MSADSSQASPVLENTEKMETQSPELKEGKVEAPPPIFVSEIGNYAKFSEILIERGVNHCVRKETSGNELVLSAANVADYCKLQQVLTEESQTHSYRADFGKIEFHTYQIKSDFAFIIFIRHLLRTMDPLEIRETLVQEG